jgi:DNA-binding NarL/FixJ family response regulator
LAAVVLAGADGCVNKGAEDVDLPETMRRVHAGERVWAYSVPSDEAKKRLALASQKAGLTRREREVFALVLDRYSNEDISKRLRTSPNTTKNQVSSILRKLGVGSRKALFWSQEGAARDWTEGR